MKRFATILFTSIISALLAVVIYKTVEKPQQVIIRESVPVSYISNEAESFSQEPHEYISYAPTDFISAANHARKAVVSIQTRTASNSFWRGDAFTNSSGSGVIISSDGYIATNNHVIEEGDQITVTLGDRREFDARTVGTDSQTDLALLKIDAGELPFVKFGNSDSLQVGEWVLAIGNPFRLLSTVTAGIVSAKGRNISILQDAAGIESFIQTDAAVNPGNSGGALVNTMGELVGINTAIITYSGQYEGFSFAVPSNLARKVLADIRQFGSVQRGWLGVSIRTVNDDLAQRLNLREVSGIYIDQVNDRSAAEYAGLRSGDVITGVNGQAVKSTPEFMEQVGRYRPGDKIVLSYFRGGKEKTAEVILSSSRTAFTVSDKSSTMEAGRVEEVLLDLGFEVRNLSAIEKGRLRSSGVFVVDIQDGSIISETNMENTYIITKVNGRPVTNVEEFVEEVLSADGRVVLEGFYEDYPGDYPYVFEYSK